MWNNFRLLDGYKLNELFVCKLTRVNEEQSSAFIGLHHEWFCFSRHV